MCDPHFSLIAPEMQNIVDEADVCVDWWRCHEAVFLHDPTDLRFILLAAAATTEALNPSQTSSLSESSKSEANRSPFLEESRTCTALEMYLR